MLQKILVIGIFVVGVAVGGVGGFNVGKATSLIDGFNAAMESEFCDKVVPRAPAKPERPPQPHESGEG